MFGDITFPVYLVFRLGTWALFAVLTVAGILAAPVAFIIGTISLQSLRHGIGVKKDGHHLDYP